jgi:hypothetical protein
MTFPFGQRFFNLPPNGQGRAAFPFEKAQPIPQTNDFALFFGVHGVSLGGFAKCERKENRSQAARNSIPAQGNTQIPGPSGPSLRKNARLKRVMAFEPAVTLDRVDRTLPLDEAPQPFGET